MAARVIHQDVLVYKRQVRQARQEAMAAVDRIDKTMAALEASGLIAWLGAPPLSEALRRLRATLAQRP